MANEMYSVWQLSNHLIFTKTCDAMILQIKSRLVVFKPHSIKTQRYVIYMYIWIN